MPDSMSIFALIYRYFISVLNIKLVAMCVKRIQGVMAVLCYWKQTIVFIIVKLYCKPVYPELTYYSITSIIRLVYT